MTQSSSIALDLDNASDVEFVIPRSTDLLLKLKRSNRHAGWAAIIGGTLCCAVAIWNMLKTDALGWHVYIWWGLAIIIMSEDGLKRHKKQKELTMDLLEALVAQNNQFRRELEKLAQSKA